MAKNSNLHAAKAAKNDEFYTQLSDIEKELAHYKEHFRDKVVFCNCDDPTWSNFWRYFHLNFEFLGLKKLIATHYDPVSPTYKLEYTGGADTDLEAGVRTDLKENGDFRSPECVALLDECDIVATNPPFSLFREYVALLMEHGKKFVIIGSLNCLTYKEIFPLIKGNIMWPGVNEKGGTRKGNSLCFGVPNGKELKQVSAWWFSNLDHAKRHEPLILYREYDPEKYPKYDNYDAINVDKTADIPCDYFECIGVPISFLDKYCPEQFEIIGATESEGTGFSNGLFRERESQAGDGSWSESLQETVYPQKIKIMLQRDGSGKIFKQAHIDLQVLYKQYQSVGFTYCPGIIGVPISFLDKYCPEQFEILDANDYRIGKNAMSKGTAGVAHHITCRGENVYRRILIRRK